MRRGILRSYLWQAALILLPVVLLAAYCLWALQREKNLLEEDVRNRCESVLQVLAKEFQGTFDSLISEYAEGDRWGYLVMRANAGAFLSNSVIRIPFDPDYTPEKNQQRYDAWRSTNSDFQIAGQPAGVWTFPLDLPSDPAWKSLLPQVPEWFTQLPADQLKSWQAIECGIAAGKRDEALKLINDFIGGPSGPEAEENARFLQLQLNGSSITNWLKQVSHTRTRSPAGLNLGTLSMLRALELNAGKPLDNTFWAVLAQHFDGPPNWLTPSVLARVKECVDTNNPAQVGRCEALDQMFMRHRLTSELVTRLTDNGSTNPPPAKWIMLDGRNYLAVDMTSSNRGTNATYSANAIPSDWLLSQLRERLRSASSLLPDFVSLRVELAGRWIYLSTDWSVDAFGRVLATERPVLHPGSGMKPVATFEVRLSHPEVMYQRHAQRVWILGSLIALAVVAALIGLWQTFANLRRQLALNDMKSNFVSSVSHELRAPIAAVRLMAENLERGKVTGREKTDEYVRFIGQECRRLSALIENVLDFSRIEQGRKEYEFEPTNLGKLVDETVRLMKPYADERGVKLTGNYETQNAEVLEGRHSCRPPEEQEDRGATLPIEMSVDGRAIQQALINLIDNAIKHSPAGETVTIGLKSRTGVPPVTEPSANSTTRFGYGQDVLKETGKMPVLLSITDHGPGIPKVDQEKIFERFYRRGSELRRETQGIGIGLSIVKHIVDAHGGRIWVESEPGKGSRFVIELKPQTDSDGH